VYQKNYLKGNSMSKISDEKKKHMAAFLSSLATAAVNVGIFAPSIAYLFNIGELQTKVKVFDLILADVIIGLMVWVMIYQARKTLEGLEEKIDKPSISKIKRK
jgi:hypothetical protein